MNNTQTLTTITTSNGNHSGRRGFNANKQSFRVYEQQLERLENSLVRSEQSKDSMIKLLNKFETNFSKLEFELTQLNNRIDVLKRSCDNIDKTVKCIEQVENKYMTGARVKKRIELGVNGNLPTFLQSLDQIDDAIKFFNRNSNFKGAKKLNEHLMLEREQAIKQLEIEFLNQLNLAEKRMIDPYMIGSKDLVREMITEECVAILHRIAKRLDSLNGSITYRKALVASRSRYIMRTLSKIYAMSTVGDAASGAGKMAGVVIDSVISTTKKAYDATSHTTKKVVGLERKMVSYLGKDAEKLQSNVDQFVSDVMGKVSLGGDLKSFESDSGSKFIFFMNFFLRLLQAEKEIVEAIVPKDINNKQATASSVFESVIDASWRTFMAQTELIASQSQTNEKVFALLNVLDAYEGKLQQGFKQVLYETGFRGQEQDLAKSFTKELSHMIREFSNEIGSNNIPVSPDGSVHQATANAINFIKRLFTYSSVQEILSSIYRGRGSSSAEESFLDELFKSVDANIEAKSHSYSHRPLRFIFICNNYHYISCKLQELLSSPFLASATAATPTGNSNSINSPTTSSNAADSTSRDPEIMIKAVKAALAKKSDPYSQKVTKTISDVVSETWNLTLNSLRYDNCKDVIKMDRKGQYGRSTRNDIKKRLTSFNKEFLTIYNDQRKYTVFGIELKERLRKAMIETVIPVYVKFDEEFCSIPFTKNKSKYVSYSASSMEQMLLQLYDEMREEADEKTMADDDF